LKPKLLKTRKNGIGRKGSAENRALKAKNKTAFPSQTPSDQPSTSPSNEPSLFPSDEVRNIPVIYNADILKVLKWPCVRFLF